MEAPHDPPSSSFQPGQGFGVRSEGHTYLQERKSQAEQVVGGRLRCVCQVSVQADKSNVAGARPGCLWVRETGDTPDKSLAHLNEPIPECP